MIFSKFSGERKEKNLFLSSSTFFIFFYILTSFVLYLIWTKVFHWYFVLFPLFFMYKRKNGKYHLRLRVKYRYLYNGVDFSYACL
jgi:hypothetical protein